MASALSFNAIRGSLVRVDRIIQVVAYLTLFGAVALSHSAGKMFFDYQSFNLPTSESSSQVAFQQPVRRGNSNLQSYNQILRRNIFGQELPVAKNEEDKTPTAKKIPKMRLVGVYYREGATPFAIIESEKNKEQDVFDLNTEVFSVATLSRIAPNEVELTSGDQSVVLKLEDGDPLDFGKSHDEDDGEKESVVADGNEFTVAEEELSEALDNLPRLLSQARAVPYFRNGQSIGMRLFAIRSGSLYDKLGLKNGDIIKSVNDNSLSDPTQALKIFQQLRDERSIFVNLERTGQDTELRYSIE